MNGIVENLLTAPVARETILRKKVSRSFGYFLGKMSYFLHILLYKIKRHLIPVWGLRLFSVLFTLVAHERVRTHSAPNKEEYSQNNI